MDKDKVPQPTPGKPPEVGDKLPYREDDGTFVPCRIVSVGTNNPDEGGMWNVVIEIKEDDGKNEHKRQEGHIYLQQYGFVNSDPPAPPWPSPDGNQDDSANESPDPNVDPDI